MRHANESRSYAGSGEPAEWDDTGIPTTGVLALFLGGSEDSFTGLLLTLIAKADPERRVLLGAAFPREVMAWATWMEVDAPTFATLRAELDAQHDPGVPGLVTIPHMDLSILLAAAALLAAMPDVPAALRGHLDGVLERHEGAHLEVTP